MNRSELLEQTHKISDTLKNVLLFIFIFVFFALTAKADAAQETWQKKIEMCQRFSDLFILNPRGALFFKYCINALMGEERTDWRFGEDYEKISIVEDCIKKTPDNLSQEANQLFFSTCKLVTPQLFLTQKDELDNSKTIEENKILKAQVAELKNKLAQTVKISSLPSNQQAGGVKINPQCARVESWPGPNNTMGIRVTNNCNQCVDIWPQVFLNGQVQRFASVWRNVKPGEVKGDSVTREFGTTEYRIIDVRTCKL